MNAGAPMAVFGGTFNPVHHGHLRAAIDVYEALGIEDFRLLPCGRPPHRSGEIAPAQHRLAMLQRAISTCSALAIDDREIRRPGPSYMVDTLEDIHQQEAPGSLVLVIGQDSANGLNRWHRWQRLFELAHLVVMQRAGSDLHYPGTVADAFESRRADSPGSLRKTRCGRVWHVQIDSLPISASLIRRRIRARRSVHYLLPASVLAYIEEHGLYRT